MYLDSFRVLWNRQNDQDSIICKKMSGIETESCNDHGSNVVVECMARGGIQEPADREKSDEYEYDSA